MDFSFFIDPVTGKAAAYCPAFDMALLPTAQGEYVWGRIKHYDVPLDKPEVLRMSPKLADYLSELPSREDIMSAAADPLVEFMPQEGEAVLHLKQVSSGSQLDIPMSAASALIEAITLQCFQQAASSELYGLRAVQALTQAMASAEISIASKMAALLNLELAALPEEKRNQIVEKIYVDSIPSDHTAFGFDQAVWHERLGMCLPNYLWHHNETDEIQPITDQPFEAVAAVVLQVWHDIHA